MEDDSKWYSNSKLVLVAEVISPRRIANAVLAAGRRRDKKSILDESDDQPDSTETRGTTCQ